MYADDGKDYNYQKVEDESSSKVASNVLEVEEDDIIATA